MWILGLTGLRRTSLLGGHLLSAGSLVSVLDRIDCRPRKVEETNLFKVHLQFQRDKDMNQRKKHTYTQYSHLHQVYFHYLLFHRQFHFALTWDHCILKGYLPSLGQTNLTRYHLHIQLAKNERKREYQQLLFKWVKDELSSLVRSNVTFVCGLLG